MKEKSNHMIRSDELMSRIKEAADDAKGSPARTAAGSGGLDR